MILKCMRYRLQTLFSWLSKHKKCRRLLIFVCTAAFLAFVTLRLFAAYAPGYYRFPEEVLATQQPARYFYDDAGNVAHVQRGSGYQWRFPIELSAVSPACIRCTLAVEDKRFYAHGGVDYLAALRACGQALRSRRIISGSSTISMQVANLACGRERSLRGKIRQCAQAFGLEQRLGKDEILSLYLNHANYGGKIFGIEAAALYYFGKHAAQLNREESALLAGLPQRPNAYRPDRNPERALQRYRVVRRILHKQGIEIAENPSFAFRDFTQPFPPCATTLFHPHYYALALRESDSAVKVKTALNVSLQLHIERILRERVKNLPGVSDAACVIIENKTGYVRALCGTLDFNEPRAGQVNVATRLRSFGSAYKPFIYLCALENGDLIAPTLLLDAPLVLADYRPRNFEPTYSGNVTAQEALRQSLNTPAVRVLMEVKPEKLVEKLSACGIKSLSRRDAQEGGLSLALGSRETTLLDLTNAYAVLARGGVYQPYRFTHCSNPSADTARVFSSGACAMILAMMRHDTLPDGVLQNISWKTGTSNGNRDACLFFCTPAYTVGLWFGNKNGARSEALVGRRAALPAAAEIAAWLPFVDMPPPLREHEAIALGTICAQTGLAADVYCEKTVMAPVLKTVSLKHCTNCRHAALGTSAAKEIEIVAPEDRVYCLQGSARMRIPLQTRPENLFYYLNGRYLGASENVPYVELSAGTYTLDVLSENPSIRAAQTKVIVVP